MTLSRCLPSALMLLATAALAQPATIVDLAAFPTAPGLLTRVYGSTGEGRLGVPVAGGHDLDGDGFRDLAVAYFTADPLGRDYDGDGAADLFLDDFFGTAEGSDDRVRPGVGHVLFDAASLRDREFDLDDAPASLAVTTIVGPTANSLGADTAADGDFDGDRYRRVRDLPVAREPSRSCCEAAELRSRT